MADFWVQVDGLPDLARDVREVAHATATTTRDVAAAGDHDTGMVADRHTALVERWRAGLETSRAAVLETAAEVTRCAGEYRRRDDDAAVTFDGLSR